MTDRKLPISSPSEQAPANRSPQLLHHHHLLQQQHPAAHNNHHQQQLLRRLAGEQQHQHGIATAGGTGETLAGEGGAGGGGSGPVPSVAPAPPPRGTSTLSSGSHHLQAAVALASVNSNSLGGVAGIGSSTNHAGTAAAANSAKHANMHRLKHTSSVSFRCVLAFGESMARERGRKEDLQTFFFTPGDSARGRGRFEGKGCRCVRKQVMRQGKSVGEGEK